MILFGVLIFSYIMNEYIALLEQYKESIQEYNEGDELKLFFGVLRKFNDNENITLQFQKRIEDYFTHRWEYYRCLAF